MCQPISILYIFNIFIMRDYLDITNGYFIEEKAFSTLIAAILNYFPRHACFNEQILQHFQGLINPNP